MPRDWRLTSQKIKLTENDVEQTCLDALAHHGYWPARLHAGRFIHADKVVVEALHAAGIPIRWMTGAAPGTPDWALIHPERPGFLMEVKRPGGKLEPHQEKKIAELELWPLKIIVVDNVDELLPQLLQLRKLE